MSVVRSSLAILASLDVGVSIISGLASLEVFRVGVDVEYDSSLGCPRLLYLFLKISL